MVNFMSTWLGHGVSRYLVRHLTKRSSGNRNENTEKEIPIDIIKENFSEYKYILFQTEKVYIKYQRQWILKDPPTSRYNPVTTNIF